MEYGVHVGDTDLDTFVGDKFKAFSSILIFFSLQYDEYLLRFMEAFRQLLDITLVDHIED